MSGKQNCDYSQDAVCTPESNHASNTDRASDDAAAVSRLFRMYGLFDFATTAQIRCGSNAGDQTLLKIEPDHNNGVAPPGNDRNKIMQQDSARKKRFSSPR